MRWFSRLGSWLRTGSVRPSGAVQRELFGSPPPTEHLPATPAERFLDALRRAVNTSLDHGRAGVYRLDPSVQLLVIPPSWKTSDGREDRLSDDIDRAILDLSADGRTLSSLTWSALRDARPAFEPSYLTWAADNPEPYEGSVGLVFFVDLEAIASAVAVAAQGLGFQTRYGEGRPAVLVSDGRFEAHVGINALVAEALWTGRGPLATLQKRTRALPSEFRTFLAVLGGLRRRFPHLRVATQESHIVLEGPGEARTVDYRHLAASVRFSRLSVDSFLDRIEVEDVVEGLGEPSLALRSPALLRAWPDALHEDRGTHVLVAVRVDEEGRQRVVTRTPQDRADRLEHYKTEASRQVGFARFDAHAFVLERNRNWAVALAGDRVAGAAVDPRLIRGLLEALIEVPERVRVVAEEEDALLLLSTDADDELELEAWQRLNLLGSDLNPDGSDRLPLEFELEVPSLPAGAFELNMVDPAYFEYRAQAELRAPLADARRALLRGMALRSLGALEPAVGWFERAFRADRDDGDIALVLGQALCAAEQHERALPILQRSARLLPESAEAANALGLAAWSTGDTASAAEAFEKAVRLEPMEAAFLVNLGRSYVDSHLFSKARACLERALRLEPESAEAHASMALLCHRTGDVAGARRHARVALAEQPDDHTVRRLLEALDED